MTEPSDGPLSAQLVGFEQLELVLGGIKDMCIAAMTKLAQEIKIMATPYPAEGPWNTPGAYPARWYQRHFGSRWARVDGSVGGSDSSQQLQKNWLVEQRGDQVVVGNSAGYAPYVMGAEQRPYHADHGWRKLNDIAIEVIQDRFPGYMADELEKAIAKAGGSSGSADSG